MPVATLSLYRVLRSVRVYPSSTVKDAIRQVLRQDPEIAPLVAASGGEANVMEVVFQLLRESVAQQNADKTYFLKQLAAHNRMARQMSDYLASLVDASEALAGGGAYQCTSQDEPTSSMPVNVVRLPTPLRPIALA